MVAEVVSCSVAVLAVWENELVGKMATVSRGANSATVLLAAALGYYAERMYHSLPPLKKSNCTETLPPLSIRCIGQQ